MFSELDELSGGREGVLFQKSVERSRRFSVVLAEDSAESFALIHEAINKYGVPPAATLWSLTFGPFATRRMIRHKRGRCTNCGYNPSHAKHEVCPECGLGREVVEAVRPN